MKKPRDIITTTDLFDKRINVISQQTGDTIGYYEVCGKKFTCSTPGHLAIQFSKKSAVISFFRKVEKKRIKSIAAPTDTLQLFS